MFDIRHDDPDRIERLLLAALAANRARRCRLTETRIDPPGHDEPAYLGESRTFRTPAGPRVQLTVNFEPRFLTRGADESAKLPGGPPALPCGVVEAEFIDEDNR